MPSVLKLLLSVSGTLLLAAAGGLAFEFLGIPVSWLSGAMVAVAAAALLGAPVTVPVGLRNVVFFVVGLSMGSAVTPESLRSIATWPLSVVGMVVTVFVVTLAGYSILRWRGGWERQDAFLASAPGALSLIVALSESVKADSGRIVLVQSMRVALLMLALPPVLSAFGPTGVEIQIGQDADGFDALQFALLAAGGLAGCGVCILLRMPSPALLGSLLGSAVLHATGQVEIAVPTWLILPALVTLGAVVGSRFRGIGWPTLRRSFVDGLLTFAAVLTLSLAAAWVAAELLSFSLGQTALAFAPGGFDVMVVMAFALGVDPAYVAAHHLVRFVGLTIVMPLLLGRGRRDQA